ncbi:MAG: glycoside hydrolase family 3 C-terminal domain-containing protein [Bacteroidetes bacterium]|nr:glycoside hydrolase family 3 C-terminal domain-containing protein [Bacteroidota bacterium]
MNFAIKKLWLKHLTLCFSLALFTSFSYAQSKIKSDEDWFHLADSLLKLLTLEEKAGQMTNVGLTTLTKGPFWNSFDTLELDSDKMHNLLIKSNVGSIQNKGTYPPCRYEWARIIRSIQDYIADNSKHNIPVIYGMDAVHGANYTAGSTLFPHQIGLAATWNTELAIITGEVTAYEMRASSQMWNFGPVLDLSKQALWGRIFETFGEDTYLQSKMGVAFLQGLQGNNISDTLKVASCLKHFVGYGTPVTGKDRSPALIPEHYLRQYYIEPFKQAIEQGALTVMLNSGTVNGMPGHADHYLITEVLKGELGLKGFVVSDWEDISRLASVHRVAKNPKDAARVAVMAGVDMSMVPYDASFAQHIVELVEEGLVPMSRVDDAVRRILFVKFKLGLFENSWHNPDHYPLFGSEEFAKKSYNTAAESITLLKNENKVLPLNSETTSIFIAGPTANRLTSLNGPWSRTWSGDDPSFDDAGKKTLLDALKFNFGDNNVSYRQGTDYEGEVESYEILLKQAKNADVIIVALGERPSTEKPSDIDNLELPENQTELVKRLAKAGKPVIVVLLQGRPRIIREIEEYADAIIHAYWPGNEGGRALADVIAGYVNPSGKLPYTYPRHSAALYTYQHKGSDRLDHTFGMDGFNPQWEFGHGLSYTNFELSNLTLSRNTFSKNQKLIIKVDITNTGDRAGKEVIQLYIRQLVASISPDEKKLVGFQKVYLEKGEKTSVEFIINDHDLAFVNLKNKWVTESGVFNIIISTRPDNFLESSFNFE